MTVIPFDSNKYPISECQRKTLVKQLMALGLSRNDAEEEARMSLLRLCAFGNEEKE